MQPATPKNIFAPMTVAQTSYGTRCKVWGEMLRHEFLCAFYNRENVEIYYTDASPPALHPFDGHHLSTTKSALYPVLFHDFCRAQTPSLARHPRPHVLLSPSPCVETPVAIPALARERRPPATRVSMAINNVSRVTERRSFTTLSIYC